MATTLGRQAISNGTAPSVTITSAYRVSADEFLLIYTYNSVVNADIFLVPSANHQELLAQGAGGGEHLNAVLAAGSSDLTEEPIVTSVLVITD